MSGPMAYDTIHNNYEDGVGGGHVLEVNSGGVAGGISGNSGPALGGVKQGGYYSEGYGSGYTLDPTKPRDGLITSFPAICGKIVEAYTTIRKRPYPKKSKVCPVSCILLHNHTSFAFLPFYLTAMNNLIILLLRRSLLLRSFYKHSSC